MSWLNLVENYFCNFSNFQIQNGLNVSQFPAPGKRNSIWRRVHDWMVKPCPISNLFPNFILNAFLNHIKHALSRDSTPAKCVLPEVGNPQLLNLESNRTDAIHKTLFAVYPHMVALPEITPKHKNPPYGILIWGTLIFVTASFIAFASS